MKWWPYGTFEMESTHSPEKVYSIMNECTSSREPAELDYYNKALFFGWVEPYCFDVFPVREYRSRWTAFRARGRIKGSIQGMDPTVIRVSILFPKEIWFTLGIDALVILGCIISQLIFHFDLPLLVYLLFIFYLIIHALFSWWESYKAKQTLKELLK